MEKKICFVIMGFGKKKDPITDRTIDLDKTYQAIIRPAVTACNLECVRADEITETGIIDRSMYALLYRADVVIADVSTFNPNAIYELGVRHTLKKYSTIIIKEGKGNIPFDFSHNRILSYEHLGNDISASEAKRCREELEKIISEIIKTPRTDSPLYIYIPGTTQPVISEKDLAEIIGEQKEKEKSIYMMTDLAKKYKNENKFQEAAEIWGNLSQKVENEIYFIQQQALCTYKSEYPSKLEALTNALTIMDKIKESNDTETLGILGSINKRIWRETHEPSYLDRAIEYYSKGWNIHKDYYTGENYAVCLLEKANNEINDEQIFYKIGAKKIFNQLIPIISRTLDIDDPDELIWKYASLSNAYLAIHDKNNADKYEKEFLKQDPKKWEEKTFYETRDLLQALKF